MNFFTRNRIKLQVVIVLIISILSVIMLTKTGSDEISGKGLLATTIDKGTEHEYVIHADDTKKYEQAMPSEYVQGPSFFYNFKKDKIYGYGEPYYNNTGLVTKTSYFGTEKIDEATNAVMTFGYAQSTTFAGMSAVKTDSERQPLLNEAGTWPLAARSSTEKNAHQAAPPKLIRHSDGTFGLLSGPFDEKAVYQTIFDDEFNIVQPTKSLGINDLAGAPYGGYITSNVAWLLPHNMSWQKQSLEEVYLQGLDIETLQIKSTKTLQLPPSSIVTMDSINKEVQANFGGLDLIRTSLDTDDGGIIGPVLYGFGQKNTVRHLVGKWDKDGTLEYYLPFFDERYYDTSFDSVLGISNQDYYYYWQRSTWLSDSKLMRVNIKNPGAKDENKMVQPTIMKTLPSQSSLQMSIEKETGTIFFYGYISTLTEEMKKFGMTSAGLVIGQMDQNFEILSIQNLNVNGYTVFKEFEFNVDNPKKIKVGGDTRATNFIDSEYQKLYSGKAYNPFYQLAFWGTMTAFKNHAPGIRGDTISINKDDYTTSSSYDKALLSNIQVTDNYDLDTSEDGGGKSQEWLDGRINRNPNKLDAPIDWKGLGLDKNQRGPYVTKYFVTDSTLQQSSTSRLVNILDDETVHDNVGALGASNFVVNVKESEKLVWNSEKTQSNVGKLSGLKAWLQNNGIDESFDMSKVTIDDNQLATINQTTALYKNLGDALDKSAILKPYPLTFTYEYASGLKLKRTIQIFVVDESTTVHLENEIVMYGNDYRIPLSEAKNETKQTVYTHGKIRVYDLKGEMLETEKELSVLADSTKNTGLNVGNGLKVINDALEQKIVPTEISYEKTNKKTTITIKVYIDNPPIILHLQQVVLNKQEKLVVPTMGNVNLSNVNEKSAVSNYYLLSMPSEDKDNNNYAESRIILDGNYWNLAVKVIEPEYYSYVGHIVTEKNVPHEASKKTAGAILLDGLKNNEYWVTVYIEPTTDTPQFYGWGYGNDKDYQVAP